MKQIKALEFRSSSSSLIRLIYESRSLSRTLAIIEVVVLYLVTLMISLIIATATTTRSCLFVQPSRSILLPMLKPPATSHSNAMMSQQTAGVKTLATPIEYEEVIKKSRFIARSTPASTFAEAQSFLKQVGDPKATHNCWAFRGQGEERCSDDGEPGGTAGRPILSAIESENLVDVMVVVTRYYGGIKLGTGGLVRAYGWVARTCLRNAETIVHIPKIMLRVKAPLAMAGQVFQAINRAEKVDEDYTVDEVIVRVKAEDSQVDAIKIQLQDSTRGAGSVERLSDGVDAAGFSIVVMVKCN